MHTWMDGTDGHTALHKELYKYLTPPGFVLQPDAPSPQQLKLFLLCTTEIKENKLAAVWF